MNTTVFDDGIVIEGDCCDCGVIEFVRSQIGSTGLIIADPPYGNVVDEDWDQVISTDVEFADWMVQWTRAWTTILDDKGAFYVWGGLGAPGFRPFYRYVVNAERPGEFELANHITWKKKRAYGVQHNYLFTREELAYFTKGPAKKPRMFNVPLLDEKRGYAGYNVKYPAKSEFYRRSNVWTDINEIMRGKVHPTQKPKKLHEVIIGAHTSPGEWVVDPFAGSGVTGHAARALGRKFCLVEKDPVHYAKMVDGLSKMNA